MKFLLAALALSAPLFAHHSFAAEFDDKKPVTLRGIVTRYDWTNPHVYFYVDVKETNGSVTNWGVEFQSPIELRRIGWTQTSLKVGENVTVEGSAARDGSKTAGGKSVVLANGKRLTEPAAAVPITISQGAKPAPHWPGGHIRLGAEPGQHGYWANPSAGSLYEASAGNLRMNSDGLLANIADAGKVAPFQPWAKGLYEYRQRNFLKDDPGASCLPPGGPRQFQIPNGVQFIEDPDRARIFVISGGGNRNWRLIYLDGRTLPTGDDVTPTYYGYTDATWQGDTLVTTAVGFNERFWFSNGGLPHSESLKLTERISRPDYNTLKYDVTVDDAGAYTRPWTGGWTLQWVPEDIGEYFCDDSNRDPVHLADRPK
jgi:hypothetical protein